MRKMMFKMKSYSKNKGLKILTLNSILKNLSIRDCGKKNRI